MWIALNDGFISVVQADMKRLPKRERKHRRTNDFLCVRARNVEHLRSLFPDRHIYQLPCRDYPARIFIDKADFAEFMTKRVLDVNYGNFKSSVADQELHDAYMGVWSVMHGYQYGRYRRAAPRWDSQQAFDWTVPQVNWREEMGDEAVCGMLGCTEENPCRDCILDAVGRYGDFDEEEDADAQSHLRVPPR